MQALLVGFALSVWVVQLLGLKAYAALLWLPILVACIIYALPVAGPRMFSPHCAKTQDL